MRLQIKYCLFLSCLVNYRHLGRHLFFYQELEIRLKQQEMEEILTCKITHKLAFCIILSTIFTFIVERSWTELIITKPVSKCVRGKNEQLLKTSGADVLSSRKENRKTSKGVGNHPPPPAPRPPPSIATSNVMTCVYVAFYDQYILGNSTTF